MQTEQELNEKFWYSRWINNETGWDVGYATPAISTYLQQYTHKDAAILIPGCGNAHEADFLLQHGFSNITLIDIAPRAVEKLQQKFDSPSITIICGNFFEHHHQYDLMIEQTFFCALPPAKRNQYAKKAASLLNENGKLIGVLFNTVFEKQGPPFGGSVAEYELIFEPFFSIQTLEECYNSIVPRAKSEVFINFIKKNI